MCLDILLKQAFLFTLPTFFLLSSWLFCAFELSLHLSGEITTKLSLLYPPKQVETLEDLLDSNISLVVAPSFTAAHNILNKKTLDRIAKKIGHDKTMLPFTDIHFKKRWISSTSQGKAAIFLYEVPLKMTVIYHMKSLKPNSKFRFIDERFGGPSIQIIASSMRLPKEFRDLLNLRQEIWASCFLKLFIDNFIQGQSLFFEWHNFKQVKTSIASKQISFPNQ